MAPSSKNFLCLGLGYTASYFIPYLQPKGWDIIATKRTGQGNVPQVTYVPFDTHINDLPRTLFHQVQGILLSIPPTDRGDPVFEKYAACFNELPHLQWLGYLSATNVYGDYQGAWIDETAACHPTTRGGSNRLKAEEQWLSLFKEANVPVHIFRLAGIYGPGRNILERLLHGSAQRYTTSPTHVFNRVHVEDIARVLIASLENPCPGSIYHLADDEPASARDVMAYGAQLLGLPLPPEQPLEARPGTQKLADFYKENKRLNNAKIKKELDIQLRYPTYREGLKAIATQLIKYR